MRTVEVTPTVRRRAARRAFFRNYGVMRITSGQQKAILDGRANGTGNGRLRPQH